MHKEFLMGNAAIALGAVAAGQGVVGKYVDHHVAAGALLHQIGKVVAHQRVNLGVGSVDRHGQVDFLIFACLLYTSPSPRD